MKIDLSNYDHRDYLDNHRDYYEGDRAGFNPTLKVKLDDSTLFLMFLTNMLITKDLLTVEYLLQMENL